MSWSYNRDPDFVWPLKFLPMEPDINEARILTFGYNANFRPGSGRNKMSILDFAKDLLYDLKYSQDESGPELEDLRMGERPIIFIVHSMGGLIAKEAYMQGQNDPAYDSIIKAVSAIILLSTPHRGTNLADTLNCILRVSFATSPKHFISELSAGSQTFQKLNEQFRHIAPKLDIVFFYETRPTPLPVLKKSKIMVLEKDSSVLGYPGEISKPLDADHHGVCKYDGPSDPRYVTVRNVLKRLIGKIKLNGNQETSASPLVTDFSDYLSLSESPDADYNFFRDRWTPDKREMSMMLRSLACQLAASTPIYADKIRQLKAAGTELKMADYRSIWQWLFKQALFHLTDVGQPLYFVIDGIDEADRPASIVRLLAEMHVTSVPIRLLMVSRNTYELSSAFQKLAKQVDTETIRIEGNPTDFRAYINNEMDLGGDATYREQVTSQLLERAMGNFLWVHLAVQRINSCHTRPDVEKALTELPSGMEALYDRMALSVKAASNASNRTLGQAILGWATCAHRLLSAEELKDALGNDSDLLEIHRTITDLCGGFVAVDHEGKVAMIHETAREYLTRGAEKGRPLVVDTKSTNDILLKRCLARLADSTLRSQLSRGRPLALLNYAVTAWPHHLAVSSALTDLDILEAVAKFLKGPHILTWIYVAAKSMELRALVVASHHLADLSTSFGGGETTKRAVASSVITAGGRIALLSVIRTNSEIIFYNSATFEEQRRIKHPERVLCIQANKLGDLFVSYGYATTRVWDVATGDCLEIIKNPPKCPRPHNIIFAEKLNDVVVCGEDRCIRRCSLNDDSNQWTLDSKIDEESFHDTIVNFPICSALSPDGSMVAFGYRNHPLTVWELEPPMLLRHCYVRLDERDMTIEEKTWGRSSGWHGIRRAARYLA
ncbi:hypothetical protein VTI74DRAFT_8160 [Chaetomium olivicolor]